MRPFPFGSFDDLRSLAGRRPIALYGLGTVASATLARLDTPSIVHIDDEVGLEGSRHSDVAIVTLDDLRGAAATGLYVVVCTSEIEEAARILMGLGYVPRKDFLISPLLAHQKPVIELETCRASLLFSSGAPARDDPRWGGGIYELELDGDEFTYRKVYDGPCYCVRALGDRFLAVDPRRGLVELDEGFRVCRGAKLPVAGLCHGVAFCPERQQYYVAATQFDRIFTFDADFQEVATIDLSDGDDWANSGRIHPNDVHVHGDSLFVSVFSRSRLRNRDAHDGAVLEIDLVSSTFRRTAIHDLRMPHNPTIVNGSLMVLDSFRGRLHRSGFGTACEFAGFTRGLAYDGRYFYVGQNRNRQYHQLESVETSRSVDTSIVIFDERTKLSRTLPLPRRLTDIHSIVSLDRKND